MNQRKGLPKGAVIMWHGSVGDIPDGWALCDGQHRTPDLRRRFIVGAEPIDNRRSGDDRTKLSNSQDYDYKHGNGFDKIIINESQMPRHNHNIHLAKGTQSGKNAGGKDYDGNLVTMSPQTYTQYVWKESSTATNNKSVYDRNGDTKLYKINDYIKQDDKGNNQPHENRPPYYALYFIMKIIE